MTRLSFIHTVTSLPAEFDALSNELIPEIDRFHIVDESLLQETIRSGSLSELTIQRLTDYLVSAESVGADLVLVTCSTLGPAVEQGRSAVRIPVLRVDLPMVNVAISTGSRIGVAATLSTTLEPTSELIRNQAKKLGKDVMVFPKLFEGAFDAVITGDPETHDGIVINGLQELVNVSDVIVFAQASMARVLPKITKEKGTIPILISPRLAVEHLASVIQNL